MINLTRIADRKKQKKFTDKIERRNDRYPIPSQEAGNALVAPLGLRWVMMDGDGDHQLSDGSEAHSSLVRLHYYTYEEL
ncbi:hypothetical protein EVAR_21038_1 [Eumeta japonica]|uniref:Uncharacterized protein n=1 Tax=Eumeta variegata TaxID=151549 RepID=A0A4C1UZW1_EUMVA|nr:hypothetical protein EVAR_21038_1 [Eumeta japonica]